MLYLLKDKGYPKHPAQTPAEYAQHLAEFIETEPLAIIELISNSYTAWRYGNRIPNLDYLQSQFLLLTFFCKKSHAQFSTQTKQKWLF